MTRAPLVYPFRRRKWYHTEIASFFFGLAALVLVGSLFVIGLVVFGESLVP
jgi:hypothetical protein